MKKYVLSLFAVLALCAAFCLTAPKAEAATVASGTCGNKLTYTLDDQGTLIIFGTGAMKDWTSTSSVPWYSKRPSIEKIIIQTGVTTIGMNAFIGCTGLTSITIPDSVTTIGAYAFYNCTGLTSVTIPDSVTTIGYYAFYNCPALHGVYISNLKAWCEIDFGGCNANPMYYAKKLYLNNQLVTDLVIPNSVTTIGDCAFNNYAGLTSVTIPDSVTTIGRYAFYNCTGLTSVTIPNSVTTIGDYAFRGCTGLTSMTIPDSVTTIGYYAFYNTAWYDNQPDGLVYAGKVAYKYKGTCPGTVLIKEGTLGIADYAFDKCTGLNSVTIPESVISIGHYAFQGCTGLTSVTIPDSVTTLGDRAFYDCTGLTSAIIGSSITSIGEYVFSNCTGLTSVTIPNSVTTIGNRAFRDCTGLTSVTIPNGVTTIGDYAFYDCTGLISVTITDSVTTIGAYAFYNCTGLKSVTYCGTKEQWDNISIGSSNFSLTRAIRKYHDWTPATCTTPKTCTICGGTEGAAAGHQGGTWIEIISPTCTTTGLKARICDECGTTETTEVSALGHSWSGWSTTTSPTCTEEGTKKRTCFCGAEETQVVSALGHTWSGWSTITAPTCTEEGTKKHTCFCGAEETQVVSALGHSYSASVIQPTCTEQGYTTHTCGRCSDFYTEILSAKGHSYQEVVTEPTCTEQGYTTHTCSGCGDSYVDHYIAAKGHSWSAWVQLSAATCTKEGSQLHFCNCGVKETEAIPVISHSYADGVCTACGTVEVQKFDIDVARMILGNALEFQFGIDVTKIPDKTGYYAIVEKIGADGVTTTKEIPASQWGTAGKYHAVIYDGLRATEMADTFYVTIYNAEGQAVSGAKQDAVRDYVARAFATTTATGKTMMVDMLNYGAAAQVKFNYGTTDLANSKLTDAQKACGTAETPEMSNDLVKGTNYQASRFLLESRIQVQLAFKNLTADMYAIYTYTDFQGKAQEVRIEGADFVIIGGKPAGVELSALVYADARSLVNVTVYNADGTTYGTASDSIESCAVRSNGDVFVALMKFADSAKAHLTA